MATLVIWGEDDHKVRAEALATSYNTTAQKVTVKPRKVADLETLVFWGHGTSTEFCELDSDKFVALIAAWKKLNSKLKTIEMLTCNIRHKQGNKTDSYTEQVVKKLTNKQDHMNFRALPVLTTDNAVVCEFSILKYHAASATWASPGSFTGAP